MGFSFAGLLPFLLRDCMGIIWMASARIEVGKVEWLLFSVRHEYNSGFGNYKFSLVRECGWNVDGEAMFTRREIWSSL